MSKLLHIAVAVLLAAVLASCDGGSDSGAPSPTTASPTPTPTPTPVPTTSTPTATSRPAPKPRDAATLKKALMELKDLPAGYKIESGGDGDVFVVSKDTKCAKLVGFFKADNLPGSRASAARSYAGGQEGPFVDEQLDALGSAQAVAAVQKSYASAVRSCRKATLRIPGQGSSPVEIAEVAPPRGGQGSFAATFTATGGTFEGLELLHVITGVDDVIMSLLFAGAAGDDIEGATETAVDKAKSVLGGGKTGA